MAEYIQEVSLIDTRSSATPETISAAASQADIGPLDNKTALIIKLCEIREEKKYLEKVVPLTSRIVELEVKYKGSLRELRDTLQSIKFDDFLKILLGISGGIVVRAGSLQGIEAFARDGWVWGASFLFVFCLLFLIIRYVGPSRRKNELIDEIKRMNDGHA